MTANPPDPSRPRPRVAVSTCLLGEPVRYDGAARPHAWVRDVLPRLVTVVPVCPETELGMGVPREPVDLVGPAATADSEATPRMIGVTSGTDWTERMTDWCRRRIAELARDGLDGVLLKSRSPSCGVGSTPIHRPDASDAVRGDGLFALALRELCPGLPIVEDETLDNAAGREAFLWRVAARAAERALPD